MYVCLMYCNILWLTSSCNRVEAEAGKYIWLNNSLPLTWLAQGKSVVTDLGILSLRYIQHWLNKKLRKELIVHLLSNII
jgi:hypothetical protein